LDRAEEGVVLLCWVKKLDLSGVWWNCRIVVVGEDLGIERRALVIVKGRRRVKAIMDDEGGLPGVDCKVDKDNLGYEADVMKDFKKEAPIVG